VEEAYSRLSQRVSRLGRHFERFLLTVASNLADLIECLERQAMYDEVELWSVASSPGEQMQAIRSIGEDEKQKLDFMATFYSLQFLHMNLSAVDRLELELSDVNRRAEAYTTFIESQASNYQRLNAVYIDNLMELFLGDAPCPEYALCNVGTRSDQDDVDVMAVDSGAEGVENLNRALGRVVAEFFKRAGRLHFYIAESVGLSGYTSTVEEYARMLKDDITNFVMISELLSGEPMVGSWNLFSGFRKGVIDRFYGRQPRWWRFRQGFLRGLLGELHSLLGTDVNPARIDFKLDALRLAKGIGLAAKVIHDIQEPQPMPVLLELGSSRGKRAADYRILGENLMFIEVFRLLYHMFGVQEETLELEEEDEAFEEVALLMGFEERGGVSPVHHLVVRYFESVEQIRSASRRIMEDLGHHVKAQSRYSFAKKTGKKTRNVASELAASIRTFSGHLFFEDVLASLKEGGGELAELLVSDAEKLKGKRREEVIDSYMAFADSDPNTLFELMLIIRNVDNEPATRLFNTMVDRFLAKGEIGDGIVALVVGVFSHNPRLFNRLLKALSLAQRLRLEEVLSHDTWDEDLQLELRRLRKYIWLRTAGSESYRRVFRRVTEKNPQFIRHLGNVDRLRRYASGFLALPENGHDEEDARQALADYYDLANLACSIEALNGGSLEAYTTAFIELSDRYMSSLHSLCRRKAVRRTGTRVETRDLFTVFATGGYGRGEAFGDDYDLIMVLNSDDPEIFAFSKKVCTYLHRSLVQRGVIPQYRFADHFGEFVVRFSQLREWFESGQADVVDRTQLMSARMVVGSSRMLGRIQQEIVARHICDKAKEFCLELAEEMDDRLRCAASVEPGYLNIKECAGGLRDIEYLILMMKANFRVLEPVSQHLFRMMPVLNEQHRGEIATLEVCHQELRRVRDLYRLAVAAEDAINLEELGPVALIMGYVDEAGNGDTAALIDAVNGRLELVSEAAETIISALTEAT